MRVGHTRPALQPRMHDEALEGPRHTGGFPFGGLGQLLALLAALVPSSSIRS
jgi:hypothetical protein